MIDIALEWVSLLVRWTHVICAICWIGSSFYFMALDAGLKSDPRLDKRVKGEAWQVHGGGFYNIQKFSVAPDFMPEHLTWFKWEAYGTWVFGLTLLVLIYYLNPTLYLIDPSVMALSPITAVAIAGGSLVLGWVVYDLLCRSWFGQTTSRLALSGFVLLVAATYGYTHVFSGQGAFIQVGALVGTIMAANVAMIIIPNQRKTVACLLKGEEPLAVWGAQAKQRSIHNNYTTLPVLFTMLSSHYAFTYGNKYSWLVLAGIFVATFLVRHWFNMLHTGAKPNMWLWPAAAVPFFGAMLLTQLGAPGASTATVKFSEVAPIIEQRCHTCHAAKPTFAGFTAPPKGVMFDTPELIQRQAQQIMAQAVVARAMPLGNITHITDDERAKIGAWVAAGAKLD